MKLIETIQNKIKALHPPGTSCDKDIAMAVLMRDPDNFASLINATDFFAEKILEIRDPIYGYVQRPSSAMHRHDLVRRNRDVNAATNLIVKFFEEEVPAGQYCFARKELETARINLRGYLLCCIYGDYPRSEQPGIYRECAGLFQGMALRRVLLYAQSCYLPLLILDHWGAERLLPYCFSLMRRGRVWSAGIQTVIRQWLGRVRG